MAAFEKRLSVAKQRAVGLTHRPLLSLLKNTCFSEAGVHSLKGQRMRDIKFLVWVTLTFLQVTAILAQERPAPAQKQPAPRITGRLIGTDGVGQLILEYKTGSEKGTFIGHIHSACVIPAKSNAAEKTALDLAKIPKGSDVTFFYIRHVQKQTQGGKTENIILAMQFVRLNGDSGIPKGVMIPCYKAAQSAIPK